MAHTTWSTKSGQNFVIPRLAYSKPPKSLILEKIATMAEPATESPQESQHITQSSNKCIKQTTDFSHQTKPNLFRTPSSMLP